ncbi:MAG: Crp/Fnr family transcriptional regulator [Variibacter sp.]
MNYRNHLLSVLPPDALARLEPHFRRVSIEQGAMLVREGEPFKSGMFLESGVISYVTRMADGALVESLSIGREGAIGLSASTSTGIALRTALVQISGEGLAIGHDALRSAFRENESIRQMMLGYTAAVLSQALQRVVCNARHSVEERLAWWLLINRDRIDGPFIEVKHDTLAAMLGVQRSTITLAARAIQAAGLIRYSRGVIELLDPAGLSGIACECYDKMQAQFDHLIPRYEPSAKRVRR